MKTIKNISNIISILKYNMVSRYYIKAFQIIDCNTRSMYFFNKREH